MPQTITAPNNNQVKRSDDGAWTLDHNDLYFDVLQLLQATRIPDSDENRNIVIAVAIKLGREFFPNAVLHIIE